MEHSLAHPNFTQEQLTKETTQKQLKDIKRTPNFSNPNPIQHLW